MVQDVAYRGVPDAVLPLDTLATRHDVSTLADLPFHLQRNFAAKVLMKRFVGRTTLELTGAGIFERVREIALGLSRLGVTPRDRVAIISESRPEWVMCDLATVSAGAITVPVYPTQSISQIDYILRDSGARVLIVSGAAQLEKLRRVRASIPGLEHVVVIDAPPADRTIDALTLSDVAGQGRAVLEDSPEAANRYEQGILFRDEHELATIVYTMDESGALKGAMLTHANLLANVRAIQEVLPVQEDDVALSLLPLSHVFERTALFRYLFDGVTTVFVESLMTVMRDLKRVRPSVMTGVPRVYEKFFSAFEEESARASAVRRAVMKQALRLGRLRTERLAAGASVGRLLGLAHNMADRLVLSRVRAATGGRLRIVVSGSAALPDHVADFFASIGLPIYEGYGLTETSPVLTTNGPGRMRHGTVGRALPGVEIKIAEDGEILARGPNVTGGYLKRSDLNETSFSGGWFHTGDIGLMDPDGYVVITDRKKDLIVTAGGKKIAPSPLELRFMRHPLVADAIMIGENRKFPSVLIVPNFPELDAHLKAAGVPLADSRDQLVQRADVVQLYQNLVDEMNAGLAQFERIKRLALLPVEAALLERGPGQLTMLKRRQAIERTFQHIVDRLYA